MTETERCPKGVELPHNPDITGFDVCQGCIEWLYLEKTDVPGKVIVHCLWQE